MRWLACLSALAFACCRFSLQRVTLAMGIVAVTSMTYLYLVALPAIEAYRDGKPFALRVKEKLGADIGRLGLYRTREPVFYLDQPKPIQEFDEPETLRRAFEAGKVRWLIVRRRDLDALPMATTIMDREATFDWEDDPTRPGRLVLVDLEKQ